MLAGLPPWLLALAYAAYVLGAVTWIALKKREPVASLSWILAIVAFPLLGLLVFALFGPDRIRRKRRKREHSRRQVRARRDDGEDEARDALARMLERCTGYSSTGCTRARLLVDGECTFDDLLEAIAAARDHIHLEYYIVEPDVTGRRFRDALVERARAGVEVRLLVDAIGSHRLGRRFLAPMREAGIEFAWFHRVHLARILRPRLNLRTHRKLAVVDGRVGWTGGINLCDENNEQVDPHAFHDLHVRLEGEVVADLQRVFLEDWHYATGAAPDRDAFWPRLESGPIPVQVVPAGPDSAWAPVYRTQVQAMHAAQHRVWLVTPYFAPGEAGLQALCSAALRGLDVRLLLPRRSDSIVATWVARSWYAHLLAAGVRIHEYGPRMVHAKALLVDDDLALLGSANFDHRSFYLNFELAVLLRDAGVVAELEATLARDIEAASEVPRSGRHRGWGDRLAEGYARLCSPMV